MSLKGILHRLMYKDRADILRHGKEKRESGASKSSVSPVYENIPCKLSQYGKALPSHMEDSTINTSLDLRLCCDPEYIIRPGDVVKIQHQGQLFTLHAGARFAYPTHQEISLRRNKEVGYGD